MTKGQVAKLEARYNELYGRYARNMGDEDAAHAAAMRVVEIEGEKLAKRKRNEIQHVLRTKELLQEFKASGKPAHQFVADLYQSTDIRRQQVEKNLTAYLDEFAEEFNEDILGISRNLNGIEEVVREAMGDKTGNASAARVGKAIRDTFEHAHARYEAAGGILGYIKNYFPVSHKKEPIKAAGFQKWAKDIKMDLDRSAIVGVESGMPLSEESLDGMLEMLYDLIVNGESDTLAKRIEQGLANVGGAFRVETDVRRDLTRFLKWKSPEAFLNYNAKYGTGREGLYATIPHYLRSISRDIAIMEKVSPKPQAMSRNLDALMVQNKTSPVKRRWVNGMYAVLSGGTDGWEGEPSWWYRALSNTQQIIRSATMGAASLSAVTDSTFIATTARINGLSGSKTVGRYLKLLNPLSDADRQVAKRNGYLLELISGSALADSRFAGQTAAGEGGGKISQWLSNFTNKASGLAAMTKANMDAVALEAEATLGELINSKATWESLDAPFRDALAAHGLSKSDWEFMGQAKVFQEPESGAIFLRSRDIADAGAVDLDTAARLEGEVKTRAQASIEAGNKRVLLAQEAKGAMEEIDRLVGLNPDATPKEMKGILKEAKTELNKRLKELGITSRTSKKIAEKLEAIEKSSTRSVEESTIELKGAGEYGRREAETQRFQKAMDVANKVDDWIYTMRQMSTNEPSIAARSITTGAAFVSNPSDAKKGTVARALASSVFMYKSFLITNLFTHLMPAVSKAWDGAKTGNVAKMEHLASILVGTTIMGAAAIHMKDVSKGRETRDMNDWKFWKAAALQGGGFGLFSDFLFSDFSRFGRSPMVEALGPIAGLVEDVRQMAKGTLDQGVNEAMGEKAQKDRNIPRDLFKLAKRNIPAVNLWYSRLIVERLFLDQIEKQLDPRAEMKWRKADQRFYRDTGQKLYWRRGELAPE